MPAIFVTISPLVIFVTLCLPVSSSAQSNKTEVTVVDSIDLKRYAGLWYEIAKVPNRFQKKCTGNTTARYTLNSDGTLEVINSCEKNGNKTEEIKGMARVVDPRSNAKLEVSFFRLFGWSLFWGDYWIIGLDQDYQYAVIGTPTRKYGWILARTPHLAPEKMNEAYDILKEQGYDPSRFEQTPQETNF